MSKNRIVNRPFLFSLLFILNNYLSAQYVKIKTPKDLSPAKLGGIIEIVWEYSDLSGDLVLEYAKENPDFAKTIATVQVIEESFSWYLPMDFTDSDGKIMLMISTVKPYTHDEIIIFIQELIPKKPTYGKKHDQKTITYANGDKYVGEFKDDKFHGQGTFIFGKDEWEGDKYIGEWKDGKYHGQGTYTFASGSKYVGEFKDGKQHGHGTYTFFNGDKYVGEYKDDKKNGQGTLTWAGEWVGQKYVGEFKNDKYDGQGTLILRYGAKYVGEFENDKYDGQGVLTYSDGSTKSGIWAEGELIEHRDVSSVESYLGLLKEMEERRKTMVQKVLAKVISDEAILSAMAAVPMEKFAPSGALELVYGSNPVPIGYDESISQPSLTAAMLYHLNLQTGDKVLELKTASGYQTVLLAQMGMDVTTIESDWALAEHLKEVFKEFDFPNIHLRVGNYLRKGWPRNGPFDAIIATAAYANMPYKIREQLAPGGVFIVPVGTATQELIIIKREADGSFNQSTWMNVLFSMMPGEPGGP